MKTDPGPSNKRLRALVQLLKRRLTQYLTATQQAPGKDDGPSRPSQKTLKEGWERLLGALRHAPDRLDQLGSLFAPLPPAPGHVDRSKDLRELAKVIGPARLATSCRR